MTRDSTPGFEQETLFLEYARTHGVPAAYGQYKTAMRTMSRALQQRLGPSILRSEDDVSAIAEALDQLPQFNAGHLANFRSVLRKYVAMVQVNYEGGFDDVTVPATDVDPKELPKRIRTEVSRVVRDTAMCRKIKRLYGYRCQRCTKRLKLANGGYYAEGHHLQPLAQKHGGHDVEENVICVCPTCHVLFDYNVVRIGPHTLKLNKHELSVAYIAYHNAECDKRST